MSFFPTSMEHGSGPPGGIVTAFLAQPDNFLPIPAPFARTPAGVKKMGKDRWRLIWGNSAAGISGEEFNDLWTRFNAAASDGGLVDLRRWVPESNAYVTAEAMMSPPQHEGVGIDRYFSVSVEFMLT